MAEAGALQVIQSQQNLVGSSVAGGTAAIKNESSVGILEQIRDITLKSFRKTSEIASSLVKALDFDKQIERRKRDDAVELSKESGGSGNPKALDGLDDKKEPKGKFDSIKKSIGGIGAILSGSFIGKLFSPLISLFGKGGFLFRFLGPLGPIGLIIGGVMLLFKYSDEIIKALTPAIDKIKKLWAENQPLIDALKNGFDWLFKNIIGGLGRIIGGIIDDIGPIFSGFSKLLQGDIMGGLKDIGVGLLNIVLFIPRAIARFFEPVLVDIENWFMETVNSIKTFFVEMGTSISNFTSSIFNYILDIPNKLFEGIKSIGSVLVDFFTVTIPDAIKGAINSLIDVLPLPDVIKNKMKLTTSKTKAAENKVSEFGTKEKYTDRTLNPMEREAQAGSSDKLTMDEGYKEATGEQYGEIKTSVTGTSGSYFGRDILTPDQIKEYDGLKSSDERIKFLENLNKEEQTRRKIIFDLYKEKRELLANQPERFVPEKREFMSPDDEMNKFMTPKRTQAAGLVTQGGTGSITVINNSPTSVISQNDVKKTDVISGSISTSSGDNYFDRTAGTYAA